MHEEHSVSCTVYASTRKSEMYLYLAAGTSIEGVPAELQKLFGAPREVMELTLDENSKLARENAVTVVRNLISQGYHLQMPPDIRPNLYYGNED